MILKQAKLALLTGTLATFLTPGAIQAANDPVQYRSAVASADTQPQYVDVVRRRYTRRSHYVVRRRSTRKSVAIVGGSAAGGALIGAMVGGGKGAGIGALVGGAGGYIYDRKTHKKVYRR